MLKIHSAGLIIDAFGELRSQQESATEKLESNCFICDINKEFFDKLPRGWEKHTKGEHNFANYLYVHCKCKSKRRQRYNTNHCIDTFNTNASNTTCSFFLQHLVSKDPTEYTGQETYVRQMYDERNWEFFPVGECFLKQYADDLVPSS